MKSVTILALVAGASATFQGANPFTCPSNTDNKCEEKQKTGFNWGDMPLGNVDNYDKFKFNGWECSEDKNFKRRGQFDRRTPNKVIGGTCFPEKPKCPSFGSPDKFSLDKIHVSTEFDCDLEFHYDMPDGSLCRHRAPCKKGGSKIKNTQCGGAQNVTIIYPPQPNKPKPQCGITVTSIDFDCGPPKVTSTRPPTTSPTKPAATTTAPGTTSTKPAVNTSTSPATSAPATSTQPAAGYSTSTTAPGTTAPGTTAPGTTAPGTTAPGTTAPGTTAPGSSGSSTTVPGTTAPGTTAPGTTAPGTTPPGYTAPGTTAPGTTAPGTTAGVSSTTSTVTTVFPSTSTVFTTSVSTIISCGDNKPDCPGQSKTTVVTVSVPVSTTVYSMTTTTVVSSVVSTVTPGTTTTPAGPVETLPCPDVVPQCLNTWIFQLGCKDNTDTACYCPDKTFAENVFQCFYAHGASDETISKAVTFYQGICAPHIPQNPAIVTAPTVTSYITVTPAPTSTNPAAVTTIVLSTTTVVPCTDDNGSTIPSSSSTVTINTSVTVPKLGFTTAPGVSSTPVVGLIPITTPISAVVPVPTTPTSPAGTGVVPGQTTPVGATPARPTVTTPVVAGSGRVQVGAAGLAAFAAMAVAALL
ncbi:hypothetical protein RB594_005170 [Gaeumannomyces avenae]